MTVSCAKFPAVLTRRRSTISAALFALVMSSLPTGSLNAGGTLTVGMTAGDIPVTTGNPDQGFEGYRFVGYNLYDALLLWDLSKSDTPSEPKPGLATSYEIDPNDHKRWIVHLREGVSWHDGCKFTADDVLWNFQMRMDQNAPNFSPQQFTYTRAFLSNVKAVTKLDDYTVAIENNFLESLFPYTLTYVLMISPCRARSSATTGRSTRCILRAPAPTSSTASCRTNGSSWCPTRPIGTKRAFPSKTGWC